MERKNGKKLIKKWLLSSLIILVVGFLIPQDFVIPVENAHKTNWDDESFWYYPWGESIVHKGVDIFSPKGTNVFSATYGVVFSVGHTGNGGNVVYILGPKWRTHYYAHLEEISTPNFTFISKGQIIGKVGNTGNAIESPHHLHYSIETIFPYFWRADKSILGWKKIFYLNPIDYLNANL
jgi:peptidoglycan LD-endopeptidase LytH